jgi:TetR/AcrR family transcriptional regulator, transcriptional repressor for nem operon
VNADSRERILAAARRVAQAHGYSGLVFRDLAEDVGIKAASIYHHFPSKADLAAAVARRYWEDSAAALEALSAKSSGPLESLRRYPDTFRKALKNDNRICLCSFMAAEYADLPEPVKKEVQIFADVNVAWLSKILSAAKVVFGFGLGGVEVGSRCRLRGRLLLPGFLLLFSGVGRSFFRSRFRDGNDGSGGRSGKLGWNDWRRCLRSLCGWRGLCDISRKRK